MASAALKIMRRPMQIALSIRFLAITGCFALACLGACGGGSNGDTSGAGNGSSTGSSSGGSSSGGGAPDSAAGDGASTGPGPAIPIVAGGSAAVPYQFGPNIFGITGSAFFAKSAQGSSTVVLDGTQAGKVCVSGTVDVVPTPADGGHPPYSDYWGIDLGFNLDQPDSGADAGAAKAPWTVPANVVGFWFTVEGPTIPSIRFKTTPTGKDPALEQDSCAIVSPTSDVPVPILFTDMFVQCWDGPQGTAPTDVSVGLLDVSLQVAADVDAPQPVDFCLTAFGLLTQ
jgi:hypothetical protein